MARIQTPQHVQELQAEFKVREPFGLELLETIQPTYSLGRQKVASTGYPRKCIGLFTGAAGGVGTNLELVLSCPADVGIVIVVDELWARNLGGAATLRMSIGDPLLTIVDTQTTKNFRDARLQPGAAGRPQGIINTCNPLTAAPNGDQIALINGLADDTPIFKPEIILGGGDFFLLRESNSNTALITVMLWTEFLLEDR